MLRVEGSPALSGCLMSIWWAHQSSSGGTGSLVPQTQAHCLLEPLERLVAWPTGLSGQEQQRTGSWQSFSGWTRRALSKPITPSLDYRRPSRFSSSLEENREVTMQHCIEVRKAKLCLHDTEENWL